MRRDEEAAVRIGWIGTGVMGSSMAGHLLDAGHELWVHNRTKERAMPLVERGATWADDPAGAASGAEVTFAIVGFPRDVRQVFLGEDGVVATAEPGSIVVDMTTSAPSLAVEISEAASARGLSAIDAPVSGGDVGARNATLSIMVGGDDAAVATVHPLFEVLGKTIVHAGGPGAGQHTKMVNQILIASGMIGVAEALLYAQEAGLDLELTLEAVGGGAAASWSLLNYGPRMLRGDFAPGFFVEHFVKDMAIAVDEASTLGIDTPGLALALELYRSLEDSRGGRDGTQALLLELARRSGVTWERGSD